MASPQPVAVSEDIRPCSVYCGVDCSVILTLDGTLLCCGNNRWDTLTVSLIDLLLCYTDAGWHSVCCDCGVVCSVILMLDGTLCAVTGVDCSVIPMLDGTLCAVTVVWTALLH